MKNLRILIVVGVMVGLVIGSTMNASAFLKQGYDALPSIPMRGFKIPSVGLPSLSMPNMNMKNAVTALGATVTALGAAAKANDILVNQGRARKLQALLFNLPKNIAFGEGVSPSGTVSIATRLNNEFRNDAPFYTFLSKNTSIIKACYDKNKETNDDVVRAQNAAGTVVDIMGQFYQSPEYINSRNMVTRYSGSLITAGATLTALGVVGGQYGQTPDAMKKIAAGVSQTVNNRARQVASGFGSAGRYAGGKISSTASYLDPRKLWAAKPVITTSTVAPTVTASTAPGWFSRAGSGLRSGASRVGSGLYSAGQTAGSIGGSALRQGKDFVGGALGQVKNVAQYNVASTLFGAAAGAAAGVKNRFIRPGEIARMDTTPPEKLYNEAFRKNLGTVADRWHAEHQGQIPTQEDLDGLMRLAENKTQGQMNNLLQERYGQAELNRMALQGQAQQSALKNPRTPVRPSPKHTTQSLLNMLKSTAADRELEKENQGMMEDQEWYKTWVGTMRNIANQEKREQAQAALRDLKETDLGMQREQSRWNERLAVRQEQEALERAQAEQEIEQAARLEAARLEAEEAAGWD